MNQFQLYTLMPMLLSYFPPKIIQFILGMDITMFSFDFIPSDSISFVQALKDWISYPQEDSYLREMGLISGSSLVNFFSMIGFIITV